MRPSATAYIQGIVQPAARVEDAPVPDQNGIGLLRLHNKKPQANSRIRTPVL
ncbi:hypothetical protein ACQ86N_18860 [Puia sp. P3]|uniref:hypothetical protein n=1 Tax=Puia sp. P3 TaxID=3423952 RepID=UPI003D66BD4B